MKTDGVHTIAVAAYESSENVPALNLGKRTDPVLWQRFSFNLTTFPTRLNG